MDMRLQVSFLFEMLVFYVVNFLINCPFPLILVLQILQHVYAVMFLFMRLSFRAANESMENYGMI